MRYGIILELSDSAAYLHAPFLWFYTLALTRPDFQFRRKDALHLLPFVLSACMFAPNLYLKLDYLESIRIYGIWLKMILLPIYIVASLKLIYTYQGRMTKLFSSMEKIDLNWLKVLAWGMLALWLIGSVSLSLHFLGILDIPSFGGLYTNIAGSIFIILLGYFGIQQTHIFTPQHLLPPIKTPIPVTKKGDEVVSKNKYAKSGLSPEASKKIHEELLDFMGQHKPFLDPALSLFQLARSLHIQPNHLSQVINTHSAQNFFDFINQFRVESFIEEIKQNKHTHQTLLAIALDCGFNSKASFNRAFKKFTGMTPSTYIKSLA